MNEIEKLYETAGIERECDFGFGPIDCDTYEHLQCNEECTFYKYPPFTAEKQLRLTKLIGLRYGLKFITNEGMDYMLSTDLYNNYDFDKQGYGYGYDEAIANLVNNLWQDLTETEREEIRKILKG